MSSIFQKVAETPLRLRAEPVLLRLFGTAMAFVFAVELRYYSLARGNQYRWIVSTAASAPDDGD